jgi:cell division protein FtsI (penicillin-binding protein 3)
MDPNSGEILAMANYPDFDPNWYLKYERDERKNRAVNEAYELGSSLKPFTVAAALEEGLVTPEDRFNCHFGVYPYARRVIHDDHPHGMLSVTEILTFSSNIGVCQIADKVKAETLYRYFRQFGFGRLAGIDLPAESSGILPNGKDWQQIDLATYSFGQGFTVTPLQLVAAYSAIANGGTWHRPYIVKQILDKDGKTIKEYKASPLNTRHVLAKENAAKVTAMLETVVTTGTAKKAAMPGFRVAGKTGTAQKVERVKVGKDKNGKDKEIGRYGKGRMSTFVGYLPADNPKLAIIVVIDEPQGCKYGGVVAAPVFKRIAEESLNILQIFPEVATK